jgi:hypothetical protein
VRDSILGMCTQYTRMNSLKQPQLHRPHYDDSVKDTLTGVKSEWTLLIYLSGVEDGVKGGEVGQYTHSTMILARNDRSTDYFL